MTEVFVCDCSIFHDQELFLKGMGLLSPFRRKKVNNAKNPLSKCQRLAAGVLLDYGLRKYGYSEKDMEYGTEKTGKPYFLNCSDLFFSLSHSGKWAACALSKGRVGMDVQMISEYNARISERCFSSENAKLLSQLSGEEADRMFTKLWAEKESVVKYYGSWKEQSSTPKVYSFSDLSDAQIGVCSFYLPEIRLITDGNEILR